jgi:hypothetical protein
MKKIISKYRHIWRELPVRQRKPAFEVLVNIEDIHHWKLFDQIAHHFCGFS